MHNLLRRICTLTIALAFPAGCALGAVNSPVQVTEHLQTGLIDVMKQAHELGYKGRYERLTPLITETHDLSTIGHVALFRQWRKLTAEQRKEFLDTFRDLTLATYANRFDGYSGEHFSVISNRPLPRGRHLVKTILTKADGEEVHFDYLLHRRNGQWRIINIIVDGVSDLALKRAEYSTLMKEQGFTGLISEINAKIRKYAEPAEE